MSCASFAGRLRSWVGIVSGAVGLLLVAASTQAEPIQLRLDNGIEATIHTPEDLMAQLTTTEGGRTWLHIDRTLRYQMVTDVADPAIANKGDGSFHPMSMTAVVEALAAVRMTGETLPVQVYVLPYPRREVLDSSAREGMILLSPGTRPVSDYAVHFTVSHEIGHVFQYRWLPDSDRAGWQRYSVMRGIEDPVRFHAGSTHKDRPHEIFAEDFRFLFGGNKSNYSGGIENESLQLPDEIDGLAMFMRELSAPSIPEPFASLATAPNPFNPSTEVRVTFLQEPGPERARVRVYDAGGRQVRELYDASPESRFLRLPWDGRAEDGVQVPSGVYFARLDYAGESVSTKLLLVK